MVTDGKWPESWLSIRKRILKRDNRICQKCGRDESITKLQVHHIIPRIRGGDSSQGNLVTLCVGCHGYAHWDVDMSRSRNVATRRVREEGNNAFAALESYLNEFGERHLLCKPVIRRITHSGYITVSKELAGEEVVALISSPTSREFEKFVDVGRYNFKDDPYKGKTLRDALNEIKVGR